MSVLVLRLASPGREMAATAPGITSSHDSVQKRKGRKGAEEPSHWLSPPSERKIFTLKKTSPHHTLWRVLFLLSSSELDHVPTQDRRVAKNMDCHDHLRPTRFILPSSPRWYAIQREMVGLAGRGRGHAVAVPACLIVFWQPPRVLCSRQGYFS